jgi:GNAT superfamily N-acetyltransferase
LIQDSSAVSVGGSFIIIEADGIILDKVKRLVDKVFTWQDFYERMTFWVYKRQGNPLVRLLMRIGGVSSMGTIWAAVNDNGDVCGTTGLYSYRKDEKEAVWLCWFCVDPEHRGQGIGKGLLAFSIEKAKQSGKAFLRLYTSDDPSEAAAQVLYEKYGLTVIKTEKRGSDNYLFRELKL